MLLKTAQFWILCLLFVAGCGETPPAESETEPPPAVRVSTAPFGTTPAGDASLYTLTNEGGVEVRLTNYGGIVTHLMAPDREGQTDDVVLGFDSLPPYLGEHPYFGALIGRYGNRIAGGQFTLDGVEYSLATNNGPNSLHGGVEGFDDRLWTAQTFSESDSAGVVLRYRSTDGEEGYPGNLSVEVTYCLNQKNELSIAYRATTDAPTPVNLTNHTYFNLAGGGDILGHELQLSASHFTPVDATLIPTGEIRPVSDTPFDFTSAKAIGRDIGVENEQLAFGGGFDHNFVIDRSDPGLKKVATVYEPSSGRTLEVLTEEPGIQFYSGNFLDGSLTGKARKAYDFRHGFCLETQHYPDSPNQPAFPSTILRPGETYSTRTVYRFGVREEGNR